MYTPTSVKNAFSNLTGGGPRAANDHFLNEMVANMVAVATLTLAVISPPK
jgi:hypothetical protein